MKYSVKASSLEGSATLQFTAKAAAMKAGEPMWCP